MHNGIFERRPYLIPVLIVSISVAFAVFLALTGEGEAEERAPLITRVLVGILVGLTVSVVVLSFCFCAYYTSYKDFKARAHVRADYRVKERKYCRWQQRIGFPLSYKDLTRRAKEELGEEIMSNAQAARDNPGDAFTTPEVFDEMHYFYWCVDICELERDVEPQSGFDGSLVIDVRDFLISRGQTHLTKCAECSEKLVKTLCKLGDLDEIRREFELLKDAFMEPIKELTKARLFKTVSYQMYLRKRIEEIEGGREGVNKFLTKLERWPELVEHLDRAMDWGAVSQALFVANETEMARLAEILHEAHQDEETYTDAEENEGYNGGEEETDD